MSKVFFISAGQNDVKKEPSIKNTKNMYLNYGALLLSTIIKNAGFDVTLIHGHFKKPVQFINELINLKITDSTQPIFISIPSFYALSWTKEITKLLKEKVNNKIYVGGRWVIDNRPDLLKKELPFVDDVITGLGENKILKYLTGKEEDNNNYSNIPLDYTLLYERELFQPSIEISRGCGMGCSFCQEKNIKLEDLKSAKSIVSEYNKLLLNDSLNEMTPYFECSMFKPTSEWINELINEREKNKSFFSWRTESRVDSINPNLIPLLAKAGLKIIDLGLESASITQLNRMKKKYKPNVYLKKASKFIKECHDNNIKTKINIMLYAGENEKTINETKQWLREHRDYIYGVSVGVVSAFGWDCNKKEFIDELKSYGATICKEKSILGVTKFNLSNELNYEKSIKIAKEITNEFMSIDNYFYLKSFSYYPRNYTKEQFITDLHQH